MENLIVVIFTYRSPFGIVPEFVEDELPFWDKAKKVIVISLAECCEEITSIGSNAKAYSICPNSSLFKKLMFLIAGLRNKEFIREVFKIPFRSLTRHIQKLIVFGNYIQAAERYYQGAAGILSGEKLIHTDRIVLYSYWAGSATYAAIKLAKCLISFR